MLFLFFPMYYYHIFGNMRHPTQKRKEEIMNHSAGPMVFVAGCTHTVIYHTHSEQPYPKNKEEKEE